jgi:hypothetical protein
MNEKRYRGIIKTVSWRIIGTFDTFFISFIIIGRFKLALSIRNCLNYCFDFIQPEKLQAYAGTGRFSDLFQLGSIYFGFI